MISPEIFVPSNREHPMGAGQVCAVLAAALLLIGGAHTAQAQGGAAGGGAGMSGSPTGAQGARSGAGSQPNTGSADDAKGRPREGTTDPRGTGGSMGGGAGSPAGTTDH
jgi:hypothetical protein